MHWNHVLRKSFSQAVSKPTKSSSALAIPSPGTPRTQEPQAVEKSPSSIEALPSLPKAYCRTQALQSPRAKNIQPQALSLAPKRRHHESPAHHKPMAKPIPSRKDPSRSISDKKRKNNPQQQTPDPRPPQPPLRQQKNLRAGKSYPIPTMQHPQNPKSSPQHPNPLISRTPGSLVRQVVDAPSRKTFNNTVIQQYDSAPASGREGNGGGRSTVTCHMRHPLRPHPPGLHYLSLSLS